MPSKLLKILKDPIVAILLSLSIALFVIYQANGGENGTNSHIRNLVNIFQALLVVLVCYLVIRPWLQRSVNKSTTTRGKVSKSIFGVLVAILLAIAVIVILFSIAFSLAFKQG